LIWRVSDERLSHRTVGEDSYEWNPASRSHFWGGSGIAAWTWRATQVEKAVIPNCGHLVAEEKPDEFVETVLRWVDSLS